MFADRLDEEILSIIERILDSAQNIRNAIVETNPHEQRSMLLRSQGFTFDVMYDEDTEKCCLTELNAFGTRSGCGSCLFQWLKDENVLYRNGRGLGHGAKTGEMEVEFRISV
jgi:hypothetical protein